MESVQILNQFEVVTESVFSRHNFWIGIAVGAVSGLILAILFGIGEAEDWEVFLVAISLPILGVFFGLVSGAANCEPIAWETHYEVTINEEVNLKEFMDRYEIIETRGSIYTVREK